MPSGRARPLDGGRNARGDEPLPAVAAEGEAGRVLRPAPRALRALPDRRFRIRDAMRGRARGGHGRGLARPGRPRPLPAAARRRLAAASAAAASRAPAAAGSSPSGGHSGSAAGASGFVAPLRCARRPGPVLGARRPPVARSARRVPVPPEAGGLAGRRRVLARPALDLRCSGLVGGRAQPTSRRLPAPRARLTVPRRVGAGSRRSRRLGRVIGPIRLGRVALRSRSSWSMRGTPSCGRGYAIRPIIADAPRPPAVHAASVPASGRAAGHRSHRPPFPTLAPGAASGRGHCRAR